jgi:hypothetical protein
MDKETSSKAVKDSFPCNKQMDGQALVGIECLWWDLSTQNITASRQKSNQVCRVERKTHLSFRESLPERRSVLDGSICTPTRALRDSAPQVVDR